MQGMGNQPQPGEDIPLPDMGETVNISSLALLKMLKHGRAGVPLEVMGLMLGSFVDVCSFILLRIFNFFFLLPVI